jgi:hypothetical protein
MTWIYVVLLKKKLFFFPCITQKFDFYIFVKIYNDVVFSMYYTSCFFVLWKTIQIMFFFHVFVLIFCSIETTTNDCFFSRIIVQFDFFCFYFLWKSITRELFSHVRFCFLWFSKNYKKNLCIRIKLLWFLENNNRLIFSICRYTSIWSFYFC